MPRQRQRHGTGIAYQASNVVLTPARALTSHARARFRSRYLGKYRNAWLVFAFDMGLLAIALTLLLADLFLFGNPFAKPIGMAVSIRHADVVSETLTPLEVTVRSADGVTHDDVRLNWRLPSWVEVVRADPPLVRGSVLLGRIAPGEASVSHLYVRVRATPGTVFPISYQLQQGSFFGGRTMLGEDEFRVTASALTVEPVIPVDGVVPGGTIPLRIVNRGTLTAPAVIVRLTAMDGAPASRLEQGAASVVGSLASGEERVLLLNVDPTAHGRLDLAWEVQDAAQAVSVYAMNVETADPIGVRITPPPEWSPNVASMSVAYRVDAPMKLLVSHPFQATTTDALLRSYDLGSGSGTVAIPLHANAAAPTVTSWVLPYLLHDGKATFGERVDVVTAHVLPVEVSARYYAPSGDQLGVGPLPPAVGAPTTYWIVWSIGQTTNDVKDLDLRATLGPNVTATGKFASVVPGNFSINGNRINWAVPSLPATGAAPATFAFEVSFTPSAAQRGTIPLLVTDSSAHATEINSDSSLQSSGQTADTNLSHDPRASGKGKVE